MVDFTWGSERHPLRITASDEAPVMISIAQDVDATEPRRSAHRARPGLVEVLAVGHGRGLNNLRAIRTTIGDRLRYASHEQVHNGDDHVLEITQHDPQTGLRVVSRVEQFAGVDAYRFSSTLVNEGDETLVLQQVTSASLIGLTGHLGQADEVDLWRAHSEWCAESRWFRTPLSSPAGIVDINTEAHSHFGRGALFCASHSTWPSGEFVPVAALENRRTGRSLIWQLENNGPWRWELDTLFDRAEAVALALLGPTDVDHSWSTRLEAGATFETIPVSIALSDASLAGATGELTKHRRRSHEPAAADQSHPLIFNDYMNALMGDPTTEKLLPLIDAAADAGAGYFCIDAGWYDDGTDWWPSVGAWQPSQTRFGGDGLVSVLDYIREKGMAPGLWVEPEVIGVRSSIAQELPDEAFMTRDGIRIVEHDRYFLDFRSAAAREYLDGVFARLVEQYGARYFKWDYNVTPGTGPDAGATSPGEGLLDHTRAVLEWVRTLRSRYPEVILEACSSGAQRMDPATLRLYDLQSTSDQQDYRLYPAIAVAAPMAMAPEMAGNWAYPQSEWTPEQIAFTLVTGLSGRLYLSGNIDRLDENQLAIVQAAAAEYPALIEHHSKALPEWPLGLPGWTDPQLALATATEDETVVFVWNRDPDAAQVTLSLPQWRGREIDREVVFPAMLPGWPSTWDADAGALTLHFEGTGESARVIRVRAAAA